MGSLTASALIGLLVAALISFLTNITLTVIQIGLAVQAFLPTDVFYGLFDVVNEPLYQYLPYVNWFVPLDYAVLLIGTWVDVYATYIMYTYFRKILSSLFGNVSNPIKIISNLLMN
ncbi:MAG TPA: hypothetical protein DC028_01305 [Eubacterium sp.]|jgi:hypothetical protein|nr:hypothetical protein [Eubacterium sp.]